MLTVNMELGIMVWIFGRVCRQYNAPCVSGWTQKLDVILVFDIGMSQRSSDLFLIPVNTTFLFLWRSFFYP